MEGIGENSFAHRRFSHVTNAERLNYAAVGKSSSAARDVPQEARGARGQARLAAKCDKCGEHKQSVRSRRVITVGLKSGSVRTRFCNECAAMIAK